jgi:putative glycosyltransferase (TIGR04372 family)
MTTTITKKKAYYFLWQLDVIGQLTTELLALKSLFGDIYDLHIVTTDPYKNSRVNFSVYELLTRDITVVLTDDIETIKFVHNHRRDEKAIGVHEYDDYVLIALPPEKLVEYCIRKFGRFGWNYICRLNQYDQQKGKELKQALGIPDDAKIVTLHIREGGYHSQMEQYYNIRNAEPGKYLQATRYLVDQGYYLVRIGDKSMTPLPINDHRVIDAPFHPYYSDFFEPYFISESLFYVGMPSGPETLAYIFDVAMLRTNGLLQWGGNGYYKGLVIYKHYWSQQLGRNLTYQELLTSPILNYNNPEQFALSGITIQENSEQEILQGVQEIEQRVANTYTPDKSIDDRIEKINTIADLFNKSHKPEFGTGWNMQEISYMQISHEYIKLNPDFLGHVFVHSVTDPTHKLIHA